MYKLKGRKYTLLGLLLLIASGITAAFFKSEEDDELLLNGRLVASTNLNSFTCVTEFAPSFRNCHNTESRGINALSCTTDFIGDSDTTNWQILRIMITVDLMVNKFNDRVQLNRTDGG